MESINATALKKWISEKVECLESKKTTDKQNLKSIEEQVELLSELFDDFNLSDKGNILTPKTIIRHELA